MGCPVKCQTVLLMSLQKLLTPFDFWKYSKQTINSTHGRVLTISKMLSPETSPNLASPGCTSGIEGLLNS